MELETSVHSGIPVIKIIGDADYFSEPQLSRAVKQVVADGNRIAIDLTCCPFMSSAGIGVLINLALRAHPDGLLTIVGADAHLRRVLDIVGLPLHPNVRFVQSLEDLGGQAL
jgi:anti-anti-sigma factor